MMSTEAKPRSLDLDDIDAPRQRSGRGPEPTRDAYQKRAVNTDVQMTIRAPEAHMLAFRELAASEGRTYGQMIDTMTRAYKLLVEKHPEVLVEADINSLLAMKSLLQKQKS
jgi:hypothetical protein